MILRLVRHFFLKSANLFRVISTISSLSKSLVVILSVIELMNLEPTTFNSLFGFSVVTNIFVFVFCNVVTNKS